MVGRRVVTNMGAVARAVHGNRAAKKLRGGGRVEPVDTLESQILEIDKLRRSKFDVSADSEVAKKFKQLSGLSVLLRKRIETKGSYIRLFALATFFCLYSASLILQRDISSAFGVQTSAILTEILASLPAPSGGRAGLIGWIGDGGTPLTNSLLNSKDDITAWLSETIIPSLFQDSTCGDGTCDDDEELGIGRFGCRKDCGAVPRSQTATLQVELLDVLNSRFNNGVSLRESNPTFKYNIWSEKHNNYIFEKHQNKSFQMVVVEKDDTLTLRLFQTWSFEFSTDIGEADIEELTGVVASTIPDRDPLAVDYAYGDSREMLFLATWESSSWTDMCFNPKVVSGQTVGGPSDPNCKDDNNPGSSILATLQMLNSYGLMGDVSVRKKVVVPQARGGSTTEMQWISLVKAGCNQDDCWPAIPFCSALPTITPGNLELVDRIMNATTPCVSSRRHLSRIRQMGAADATDGRRRGRRTADGGADEFVGRRIWVARQEAAKAKLSTLARTQRSASHELQLDHSQPAADAAAAVAAHEGRKVDEVGSVSGQGLRVGGRVGTFGGRGEALFSAAAEGSADADAGLAVRALAAPLLEPVVVGAANGECWWCYDRTETGECYGDFSTGGPMSMDICMYYRFGGFNEWTEDAINDVMTKAPEYAGPVYAVVDVITTSPSAVSFTVDGTVPVCGPGGTPATPPPYARAAILADRARVVIAPALAYAQYFSPGDHVAVPIVLARVCGAVPGPVANLSTGLTLVPGPMVEEVMNLTANMGDPTRLGALRKRLCERLWPAGLFDDAAVRCTYQLLLEVTALEPRVWEVRLTVLMQSNGHATRARLFINEELTRPDFAAEFRPTALEISARVTAPATFGSGASTQWGPKFTLDVASKHGCLTHEDCDYGLFCSMNKLTDPAKFNGYFGCDPCPYCMRDTDAMDGACPRDRCGPIAGIYPQCLDGAALMKGYTCTGSYPLNMSVLQDQSTAVASNGTTDNSTATNGTAAAKAVANSTKSKARFVTPFNRLVGALVVTQRRVRAGTCGVGNSYVQGYLDSGRGLVCRDDTLDASPYGVDPAFTSSSSLYAGDLAPEDWYDNSERTVDASGRPAAPYGFFPHRYDGRNPHNRVGAAAGNNTSGNATGFKEPVYVVANGDEFRLYFDERIENAQANRLLTSMVDGRFLDEFTKQVTVEMSTVNPQLNMFAHFDFIFEFQTNGKISWDYKIESIPIMLYKGSPSYLIGRYIIEVLCVCFLALNCISELKDVVLSVHRFRLMRYITDMWNVVDWLHFTLMFVGWGLWLRQMQASKGFVMEATYPILTSPATETRARMFKTTAAEEAKFITFSNGIRQRSYELGLYSSITTICVLLFVLRILKAMHFQPKMALITRTIGNAFGDLLHFSVLFIFVLVGFSIAGHLFFGEQREGFSSLENAMLSLFFSLIALDPTAFFTHAPIESAWAFHIFFWSWLCLAFFVLLNILLAILVEGYISVKQSAENLEGGGLNMISEVGDIIEHEMHKVVKFFDPGHPFLSDEEVLRRIDSSLTEMKRELGVSQRVLIDYEDITFSSNSLAIHLPAAPSVDRIGLYSLVFDAASAAPTSPTAKVNPAVPPMVSMSAKQLALTMADSPESHYLNSVLTSLLVRYGTSTNSGGGGGDSSGGGDKTIQLVQLDTMRHIAQALLTCLGSLPPAAPADVASGSSPVAQSVAGTASWDSDILSPGPKSVTAATASASTSAGVSPAVMVSVKSLRGLPRMDLFRGADVFCAAFLEGSREVRQTPIRRGRSEKDWCWDDEPPFSLPFDEDISPAAAAVAVAEAAAGGAEEAAAALARVAERRVIVMVYDKDQVSADDVIGCATIPLEEVLSAGGQYDGWRDITLPKKLAAQAVRRNQWALKAAPAALPQVHLCVSIRDLDDVVAAASEVLAEDGGGGGGDGGGECAVDSSQERLRPSPVLSSSP